MEMAATVVETDEATREDVATAVAATTETAAKEAVADEEAAKEAAVCHTIGMSSNSGTPVMQIRVA